MVEIFGYVNQLLMFTSNSKLLMVNGKFKKEGDILKNPEIAKTLEIIKKNPFDIYNGSLARQIVDDIGKSNGIISLNDLKEYTVNITDPVRFKFKDLELHTMPPPGSGAVLAMVLNIIQGLFLSPIFILYFVDVAVLDLCKMLVFAKNRGPSTE